jgi:Uma2 family endonuclease
MSTVANLMTTEEMLALPENGVDRELINGELRERPMTKRNRWHSRVVSRVAHFLEDWRDQQAQCPGDSFSGEVGCILRRNPDLTVGIDVAFVAKETLAQQSGTTSLIEGAPLLAVEVLSPTDTHEDISEKVEWYLAAGTPLVWVMDPDFRTITVYRNDAPPQLFNHHQEVTAEPHLPGFKVPVAKLFA